MPLPSQPMTIGQVARVSGTPATTLRYYERRGLIRPPDRVGGQRRYDASVLARLMLIKFCRIAGLTLDDTALVIADRSPARIATKQIAHDQLAVIDEQLGELRLARRMMQSVTKCDCGDVEDCMCGAMAAVLDELRNRLG